MEDTEAVAIGDVVLDAEVVAMEAEVKITSVFEFLQQQKIIISFYYRWLWWR